MPVGYRHGAHDGGVCGGLGISPFLFSLQRRPAESVALGIHSFRVLFPSETGQLYRWDTSTGRMTAVATGQGPVRRIHFAPPSPPAAVLPFNPVSRLENPECSRTPGLCRAVTCESRRLLDRTAHACTASATWYIDCRGLYEKDRPQHLTACRRFSPVSAVFSLPVGMPPLHVCPPRMPVRAPQKILLVSRKGPFALFKTSRVVCFSSNRCRAAPRWRGWRCCFRAAPSASGSWTPGWTCAWWAVVCCRFVAHLSHTSYPSKIRVEAARLASGSWTPGCTCSW